MPGFLRNYMAEFHDFIVCLYLALPRIELHRRTAPVAIAPSSQGESDQVMINGHQARRK